jgi:DNA-binding IclR family transcriptional regulator
MKRPNEEALADILDTLRRHGKPMSCTAISEDTGREYSNTFRLLQRLRVREEVQQDPKTLAWRIRRKTSMRAALHRLGPYCRQVLKALRTATEPQSATDIGLTTQRTRAQASGALTMLVIRGFATQDAHTKRYAATEVK